ncbi:MAG: hypothetical protein JXQ90_21700 [Cyclobacteriaceae bacterium]
MAARKTGFQVSKEQLILEIWKKGDGSHIPKKMPEGYAAVYIFRHDEHDVYLKVGQAGVKSGLRYLSHHYHTTAPSTLSKSLLKDAEYSLLMDENSTKEWLIRNTTRFNILIPAVLGKHFVNFTEAFFILMVSPKFER